MAELHCPFVIGTPSAAAAFVAAVQAGASSSAGDGDSNVLAGVALVLSISRLAFELGFVAAGVSCAACGPEGMASCSGSFQCEVAGEVGAAYGDYVVFSAGDAPSGDTDAAVIACDKGSVQAEASSKVVISACEANGGYSAPISACEKRVAVQSAFEADGDVKSASLSAWEIGVAEDWFGNTVDPGSSQAVSVGEVTSGNAEFVDIALDDDPCSTSIKACEVTVGGTSDAAGRACERGSFQCEVAGNFAAACGDSVVFSACEATSGDTDAAGVACEKGSLQGEASSKVAFSACEGDGDYGNASISACEKKRSQYKMHSMMSLAVLPSRLAWMILLMS